MRRKSSADAPTTTAKAAQLVADTIPQYWIVVSPAECRLLVSGYVAPDVTRQCVQLLGQDPDHYDRVWVASGGRCI